MAAPCFTPPVPEGYAWGGATDKADAWPVNSKGSRSSGPPASTSRRARSSAPSPTPSWSRARAGEVDRAFQIVKVGAAWRRAYDEHRGLFKENVLSVPVTHLRPRLAKGKSTLGRLSGDYRKASAELEGFLNVPLPRAPEDRIKLVDRILTLQQTRDRLIALEPEVFEQFGDAWHGVETDFAGLADTVKWIRQLKTLESRVSLSAATQIAQVDPERLTRQCQWLVGAVRQLKTDAGTIFERLTVDVSAMFRARSFDVIPLEALPEGVPAASKGG